MDIIEQILQTELDETTKKRLKSLKKWTEQISITKTIPQIVIDIICGNNKDHLAKFTKYCNDNNIEITTDVKSITQVINVSFKALSIPSFKTIDDFNKWFKFDANNPRIRSYAQGATSVSDIELPVTQEVCRSKLRDHADGLVTSIKNIGYQAGNPIKVVSLYGNGKPYVILEGNTRMYSIYRLLETKSDKEELSFDTKDIDIYELYGFDYNSSFPLKTEMLKTIHIGGVKEWVPYRQARELQMNRDQIVALNPDLKSDENERLLYEHLYGGTRLKKQEVQNYIDTVDLFDYASEYIANPVRNTDHLQMISEDKFEKEFSFFSQLLVQNKIKELIKSSDDELVKYLLAHRVFIKSGYTEETAPPAVIKDARSLATVNEMLKHKGEMDGWSGANPCDTINDIIEDGTPEEFEKAINDFRWAKKYGSKKHVDFEEINRNLSGFKPEEYNAEEGTAAITTITEICKKLKRFKQMLQIIISDDNESDE